MTDVYSDITTALRALGQAYRMDWSDFDGRSLKGELELLASALETGVFDLDQWYKREGICPAHGGWIDLCDDKDHGD